VLIGIGASWMLLKRSIRLRVILVPLVVIILIHSLIVTLRATIPMITNFVEAKNSDLASAQWIEQQIAEPDAIVYCLDLVLTMEHYTTLHPSQIYEMSTDTLRDQLQQNRGQKPVYAVFNLWTTEFQWKGESPWLIYHWLLDHPGMSKIGSFGNYTLYRINE
jgi:hypothetical protein